MSRTPSVGSAAAPAAAFARAMTAFGPFEARPVLAVAVSGGADSMALALLADAWARGKGGRIVALTVDHGLRGGSAAEAVQVAAWLAARGIEHRILPWIGAKPASAIQAKARAARYALLGRWCRDAGVLHLLLAHQMDDQAETVLMRLQAGSGPDGLAGMSAIVETPDVRLLRPLLDVRRIALRACLSGLGQPWIEDPSNDNPKFLRTRLRRAAAALATAGVTTQSLAGTARRFADVRMALDAAAAELTARAVGLNPLGFAWAAPGVFLQAPAEIAVRALARVLAAVGGRIHPSAADKVRGILAAGRGENTGSGGVATLAGCVIERRGDLWLVRREVRGLPVPEPVTAGWRDSWDGRFAISVRDAPDESEGLLLAPLGENGWREILDHAPVFRTLSVYRGVRATLPAFYDRCGVAGVPSLGYVRPSANPRMAAWLMAARADFRPRRVVAGPGFFVAPIASAGDDAK